MACCTTIPPLNSPTGQKRSSGGLFDLPKSAKRRRPFTSTSITTMPSPLISSSLALSPSKQLNATNSMFSNITLSNNNITTARPVIIDASEENSKKKSVFQTNFFQSSNSGAFSHLQTDQTNDHQQFQFKNELMERIKHEAKRLIKRRQMPNLTSVKSSSTSTDTDEEAKSSSANEKLSSSHKSTSNLSAAASLIDPSIPSKTSILNNSNANKANQTTPQTSSNSSSIISSSALLNSRPKSHNDLPLFSMNQVNQICSGMMRERELLIREQYDKILAEKLNEQYDSFVKFTHEQIQRRFENSQCSYVS